MLLPEEVIERHSVSTDSSLLAKESALVLGYDVSLRVPHGRCVINECARRLHLVDELSRVGIGDGSFARIAFAEGKLGHCGEEWAMKVTRNVDGQQAVHLKYASKADP